MPFRINHIHIKSPDPRKAAEWWVEAFGFKIVSDETRPFGDRFVRCQADGGMLLSISNARTGEVQGQRPWSAIKIALAVILGAVVALAIYSASQS